MHRVSVNEYYSHFYISTSGGDDFENLKRKEVRNVPNKELQLYSCKYFMDTALQNTPFIVDRLLAPGLYVLAGAPKIGKSWLVLDL